MAPLSLLVAVVFVQLCVVGLWSAAADAAPVGKYRPVVLSPGLFCSDAGGLPVIAQLLQAEYPGIYIQNYTINHWMSLLVDMNQQVENFAALVKGDPNLADGFDLIGHSQGGLLTRAYIERYNDPPVHNWISLAGPHAGVYGIPHDMSNLCPDGNCTWLATVFSELMENGWTDPLLQKLVTFAQYWKDPFHYSSYLNVSTFLADINNEREDKNATYRANMISLNNVTLFMAELDRTVIPKESEFFGFFVAGNDTAVQNLTATPTYLGDWIGLRTLNEAGKLTMIPVNCTHDGTSREECVDYTWPVIRENTGGVLCPRSKNQ